MSDEIDPLTCDMKDNCHRKVVGCVHTIDGVGRINYCERHIPVHEALNRLGRSFKELGRVYLKETRINIVVDSLSRALNNIADRINNRAG